MNLGIMLADHLARSAERQLERATQRLARAEQRHREAVEWLPVARDLARDMRALERGR